MYDKFPVSSLIATLLILIYLLTITTVLKLNVCGKDFISNMKSHIVHQDFLHLLSNLYGLYVITRLEKLIGAKRFFILMFSILILNTLFETILHKIIDLPCSIGFSAILYGLFAWEISSGNSELKVDLFFALCFDMLSELFLSKNDVTKIIFSSRPAIVNHFVGLISGLLLGQLRVI